MARKDLPSPNAPNFLPRVREEVHALLGKLGSSTDRALTLRDAIDSGVIVPGPGGSLIPGPGAGAAEEPDLTPPPQPGAFTATGAISHFLISQAQPFYTQGHGHSRTVVYGAQWASGPLPVFADAVELDRFGGTVRAVASNPATTWHLWIKWESNDGVLSATPSGGTNGVAVTTGQDVALLLDALAGQITASELASSLSTPIGSIPGISSTAAAALAQANANLAAIGTIQTELATLSGTPDYDAGTTYALDDIVKYSGGLYRALGTTTGNLPTNTTYWQKIGDYASLGDAVSAHAAQLSDHETRITANEGELTAQASDITALQTDISTTNAAVATKASASALTALDTRVTAAEGVNTAQGSAITNLQNSVTTLNDGLATKADATALTALTTRVTAAEGVNTSQGTSITSLQSDLSSLTTTVGTKASASALSALDTRVTSAEGVNTSQATAITGLQASVTSLGDGLATKADASALTTTNANVTALSGTVSAQAGQITTLQSSVATNTASIQTEATTRATQTGELYAQYTVKTDVGGLISGYGLASQATSGDPVTLTPGLYDVAPERILSVQRNSTATYVDDAGLLQTAPANVVRYQGGQVLVEDAATNLHLQSDTLTPSWFLSACTAGASAVPGPDPAKNMRLLVPSTAVSQHIAYRQPSLVAGVTYTHSVYAKADSLDRICLWVSDTGGAFAGPVGATFDVAIGAIVGTTGSPAAEIEHFGGGVYRCSIRVTAVANALGTIGYANHPAWDSTGYPVHYAGDGVSGVLIVGAQLEVGELSSYIPTTTAVVTRAADVVAIMNPSVTSAFGVQAGQFFVAPPAVAAATAPTAGLFKGYAWRDTTANVTKYWDGFESWTTTPQTLPFVVQTVPTTINGVVVPPGVYMDSAYMRTFVAQAGQIGALAVDDAAIASVSASKITAGSIAVGQYIQSTGIYPGDGTPNFRVDGSGLAILNQAVVRGIVYASGGEFTGTVRGATIIGGTLTTAESGQRVKIDEQGILFLTGASNGKYGSFKYGAKRYGDGVLVYFNNSIKRVPFYVNSEQDVADIHLYNRAANPPAGEPGDIICVNSRLKTWDAVENRWRTLAFSD